MLPVEEWPQIEALVRSHFNSREAAALDTRLSELRAQRENLRKLFREQYKHNAEVLSWQELQAELKELDGEIQSIEAQMAALASPLLMRDTMIRIRDLSGVIQKTGEQTRKELFAGFYSALWIETDTAHISRWKGRDWVSLYVHNVIKCAWRDSNPHGY